MKKTGGATGKTKDNTGRGGSSAMNDGMADFSSSLSYGKQNSTVDENGNLWQSILNDVAQRDDVKESHLLLLGDKGAGKRALVQAINKQYIRATNKFIDVDKMGSAFAGLDSAFLYVKDLSEKDAPSIVTADENLPKMNIWIL